MGAARWFVVRRELPPMPSPSLSRRAALLLPLALAACGGEPKSYPPLRYEYLPPIRLNVAEIEIRQDFVPSGVAPDVSPLDPAQPVDALRQMAQDRLKAFGATGRAVFVIENAALIRREDTITGTMAVRLEIYTADNRRAGFAEARVSRQHIGHVDDIHDTLYDMTKQLMSAMNVEFEYQLRQTLGSWLVTGTAPAATVQQEPLTPSGAPTAPSPSAPSPSSPPPAPPAGGGVPPPIPLHSP